MRSILLLANDDRGLEARLAAALALARRGSAHLSCLQSRPFNSLVVADPFGGVYVPAALLARLNQVDAEHRDRMEARLREEGVSWEWVQQDGETGRAIVARAALADLIVITLPGDDDAALSIAGEVLLHARAPILAVPAADAGFDPSARIMVAWNGSPESAHALRLARPLLAEAGGVTLVTAGDETGRFAVADAAAYLSRYGIAAEQDARPGGGRAADALIEAAAAVGAGAIVMGAYGHTRLRETVFGGVTRDMLRHSPLPLLLAH
ncbi:universal stress protein [Sphingomonas parva]|nr:universal stress protein [Sphingomonas parva]